MNNPNMLNTYLGQKGYTLFKKELSPEQHKFIQSELTAKPYTPGAPGTNTQSTTFPVYRESSQKYYIPRYFGEAHFGPAKDSRIPEGVDIDIKFAGELRDNQKPVVKTYLDQVFSQSKDIDTILLACTHYPLLSAKIQSYLPAGVKLISQGHIVSDSLAQYLDNHPEIANKCSQNGQLQFYTTDNAQTFEKQASTFFGQKIEAKHTDLA
jgi:hypothetical protein